MAHRKRKKEKKQIKNKKTYEIIGLLIVGIGVFAFLSLYTTSAGIIGNYFKDFLKGTWGIVSFVLPFLIVVCGILTIMTYYKKVNKAKLLLFTLSVLFIIIFIHLLYCDEFDKSSMWKFIASSYHSGIDAKGSGALFSWFTYILLALFGRSGSFLILIVSFITNMLLLTNLSLKSLGTNFISKVDLSLIKRRGERPEANSENTLPRPFVGEVIPVHELKEMNDEKIEASDSLIDVQEPAEAKEDPRIKILDFEAHKPQIPDSKEEKDGQGEKATEKPESDLALANSPVQQEAVPYTIPPLNLLNEPTYKKSSQSSDKKIYNNAKLLEETLRSFKVNAKVVQVSRGPVITRYELQPAPGVKVSSIVNLADDIALNLAAPGVRIEAPIPGKAAVGVEVPNKDIAPVLLREVLESEAFQTHPSKLAFALGKDIAGQNIVADIAKMPHLLIAGATGSGKSVCINTMVVSILYKAAPDEVKLIMIDPKVVELSTYNGIPHLMIPVVTDPKKAAGALNWAVQEMVSRYKAFADKGVRDLERYNEMLSSSGEKTLPQIVVIIDELSDLMMVAPSEVEDAICRLAQMARAAGIHLVIATQRPSVDVITGVIKANIPSRIAFAVSSQTDSRTILDMAGAEKLLGRGDMLFYPSGANKPVRVQGAFVSEKEVESIVEFIKNQNQSPNYNMDVLEEIAVEQESDSLDNYDELLPEAIEIVIDAGQASISMLQRRLRVGYARAARLIDEMEARGIVSGFDGSKPRNVLITREEFEQQYKENA